MHKRGRRGKYRGLDAANDVLSAECRFRRLCCHHRETAPHQRRRAQGDVNLCSKLQISCLILQRSIQFHDSRVHEKLD